MKIMYWSDFNCPYSYIGLNRLTQAADELDLEFEWEMKAFELEPMAGNKPTQPMIMRHAVKFGLTPEDAEAEIEEIEKIGAEEGLNINYKGVNLTSSYNAHRLVKFAQKENPEVSQELIFKIYEANYGENEIIADIDVLAKIAASCGFDESEVKKMLLSDSYEIEVDIDKEDARFNGLYSIPFYLVMINEEQLSIPGAFEKEDFKIALKDMVSGEMPSKTFL